MYGHTLRTHKKIGGSVPLGCTKMEQNMKLSLSIIGYYKKIYIYFTNALVMHWCAIKKLYMYHGNHDLKVLKKC